MADRRHNQQKTLAQCSYELAILNDVAQTLNASVDLKTLLTQALEKVGEVLDIETGWVLLFDEKSGEPYTAAAQNLPPGFSAEPERMTGWCYCLRSFQVGDLSGAANVGVVTCSRLRQLKMAKGDTAGLRYHASIPLKVYDSELASNGKEAGDESSRGGLKRLGMLNVAFPEWRELTSDELALLRTIGDMLGVAVERARLHARRLEAAQTEERNRMAREIHDTIAQDFSGITFQLEAARALLDQGGDNERVHGSITAALDLARKGLEEARRSVLDLRAAPLEGHTLAEALANLAKVADTTNDLTVSFEEGSTAESLPSAVEISLFRVGQEALQNVLRHAGATQVVLRLEGAPDAVRLVIEDNGQGFEIDDSSVMRAPGQFGLLGMRERVHLLGGRFRIESTPGVGTRISADVPLDSQ